MKIGDIDLAPEIVELRFQVVRTQLFLDEILKKSSIKIYPEDVKRIDEKSLEMVQKKFPNMGIKGNRENWKNKIVKTRLQQIFKKSLTFFKNFVKFN